MMGAMQKTELWQRVRLARRAAKLTQQQVADACGITREAVSQWEASDPKKRTTPSIPNLQAIAGATRVTLAWLMADSAEPAPPTAPAQSQPMRLDDRDPMADLQAALLRADPDTREAAAGLLSRYATAPDNTAIMQALRALLGLGK